MMHLARLRAFQERLAELITAAREGLVALADVPLAALAAEGAELARQARALGVDPLMETVEAAAVLIQWKSRALLPEEPGGEADGSEGARRLRKLAVDLEHVRSVVSLLEERLTRQAGVFLHAERDFGSEAADDGDQPVTLDELNRLWVRLRDQIREEKSRAALVISGAEYTTEAMLVWLVERLEAAGRLDVSALLAATEPAPKRMALFLALLQGAQRQQCRVEQAAAFAPVFALRSDLEPEGG